MIALVLLLRAAAPAPDIDLNVHLKAKSVTIEQQGEARLSVHAQPDTGTSGVKTSVQPRAEGRRELHNVTVDIHASASLADPAQNPAAVETAQPH